MRKLNRNFLIWILVQLVLIVCLCEVCGFFFGVDMIGEPIRNWQSQSEVQSKSNDLYQHVKAMPPINTAKLYQESPPQINVEGNMDCIGADAKLEYETQQSYQTVLDQFTQAFAATGWHRDLIEGTDETVFGPNNDLTQWVVLTPNEPHIPSSKTGFTIEIGVVELRCSSG